MPQPLKSILALDVGEKRVGLALASTTARLAGPYKTLSRGPDFFEELRAIIAREAVSTLVIGWPRGLDGQHTAQTKAVENFANELSTQIDLPINWQDEAVTSRQAEAELQTRGKPYQPGDIDALAATYILEDYLTEHEQ